MKKTITIILIAAALVAAWMGGRQNGIQHAITSSEIWLAEYVEPDDGQGDWIINLDLDGETYQHVLWIY